MLRFLSESGERLEMGIKNPILRFLASSVVFAMSFAVGVIFLHGVGSLLAPWYAQEFPYSFAADGYSFTTSTLLGFFVLYILFVIGWGLVGSFRTVRWVGKQFFEPPVEDATEE